MNQIQETTVQETTIQEMTNPKVEAPVQPQDKQTMKNPKYRIVVQEKMEDETSIVMFEKRIFIPTQSQFLKKLNSK